MRPPSLTSPLLVAVLGSLAFGCGSSPTKSALATGGSVRTGGVGVTTGGVTITGGVPRTGGLTSTGGLISTGGITSTGGTVSTGGFNSTGGTTTATGGNVATGGIRSTGGTTPATGGIVATGGVRLTGGSIATGGQAVTSDAGTSVDGPTQTDSRLTSTDAAPIPTGLNTVQGFAAIPGLGLDTTTGGKGGKVVTATTLEELTAYTDSNAPLIIVVSGTIDLGGMAPLRSNKTVIGQKGAKLINGGFEVYKRQNIIIRNIIFADAPDDTMKINQNTHHVWVDHCDFTNAADGLFDITRQTSFITVSYNHFYKHSKTMLIGHSDSETGDTGFLKTTIHHNWFDGTEQRHPRVRFGEVHVINNYFLNNGLYGVASTMEADVVMESNFFEGVAHPSHVGYQESGPGDLVERNNVYQGSGTPETRGTAFDPTMYYKFAAEDPTTLPARLKTNTGAGVLDPQALIAAAQ